MVGLILASHRCWKPYITCFLREIAYLTQPIYYAKKLFNPLGLEYTKIDTYPNDYIFYRKGYETLDKCPICRVSRYKCKERNLIAKKVRPPAKFLWYLLIIPRFRRLFSFPEDAKKLVWHDEEGKKDGLIRHPADSKQWKNIDKEFSMFGDEARNLRLGLCTDRMNPYGTLSTQHKTWSVVLSIYNLPPWLCIKRKYIMLPTSYTRP